MTPFIEVGTLSISEDPDEMLHDVVFHQGLYTVCLHIINLLRKKYEPVHEISNNVVCATSKGSDQPAHTSLEYSMSVKLLTEHHLEFLSLTEAAQACMSLHLSKCHFVGNHRSRLI